MANRSHHYYVRGSNWGQDLNQGLDKAIDRLRMLMGLPEEPACEVETTGSAVLAREQDETLYLRRALRKLWLMWIQQ